MTAFHIRPMGYSDREAVIDLIWALNLHENAIAGNRRVERAAAAECLAATDVRLKEMDGFQRVACQNGAVLGYVSAFVDDAPVYIVAEQRRHVWVADLIVDAHARNQGIGRALVAAVEEMAISKGIRRVQIGFVAGNAGADAFYARRGYLHVSVETSKLL
jgi:GNAT superfamily N-acetyltransferase